jgi:hypothetical protein
LNNLCVQADGSFLLITDLIERLSPFESGVRYPGIYATEDDVRMALAAMKQARKFVRAKLGLP